MRQIDSTQIEPMVTKMSWSERVLLWLRKTARSMPRSRRRQRWEMIQQFVQEVKRPAGQ